MTPERQNELLSPLRACRICPRACGVDRFSGPLGYCQNDSGLDIASICLHQGEEPVLAGEHGICNVFFYHCNLQCCYCQNHQISTNTRRPTKQLINSLDDAVARINGFLDQGIGHVGFVSPSHMIPQMKLLIETIRGQGRSPVFVFNTNAYDRVEALAGLEKHIDVFLPDLKYLDPELSKSYSDAADYPQVAKRALQEMFRQKGEGLELDAKGLARKGMIIRHLVLPGALANSRACLEFIARELSPRLHLSIMSQYTPTPAVANHQGLNAPLDPHLYDQVLEKLDGLGMEHGWVQALESANHYQPDFTRALPFQDQPPGQACPRKS